MVTRSVVSHQTERDVEDIFQGAAFHDPDLEQTMRREMGERLEAARRSGRALRVYAGYDASRPDLHLGHTITLRKLRLFQELGHDVHFLVGTLTAQVGDPADRLYGRPRISVDQVRAAAATFTEQVRLVLDTDRASIVFNGDWLSTLTLPDLLALTSAFTVQQVTSQAFVKTRLEQHQPVGLHELMYPVMQGYDAVHLRADVQLGTVGPLFNMLAGRRLQAIHGQRPCVTVSYPVLWGTRGHRRMSKREGTHVALREPPQEQFGKVMSIDDETMRQWVTLASSWAPGVVRQKLASLDAGSLHPADLKKQLAHDLVATYHGPEASDAAQAGFERRHQTRRPTAEDASPLWLPAVAPVLDVLSGIDRVRSRSQARRLLSDGAVRANGAVVTGEGDLLQHGDILSIGRRDIFRIVIDESADTVAPSGLASEHRHHPAQDAGRAAGDEHGATPCQ